MVAFKPANQWTRENPSEEKYENLYQQNALFAIRSRIEQIENFKSESTRELRPDEGRKKGLLAEIEEAQYRVNVWTEERFRPRLYRATEAWNIYCASSLRFAENFGNLQAEQVAGKELELLEYRYSLLQRQREALFRLKFESEE
jgi:hypothetical protein